MMSLLSFKKNKKCQVTNYIAVIVFLFIFGIITMFAFLILSNFLTAFEGTDFYNGTVAQTVGNTYLNAFRIFDFVIVIMMIALIIGLGLTSYRLNAAPAFFIVSIIMATFLGFVSYFFSHIFVQIVSQSVFSAVTFAFPRTILICTNLHWVGILAFVVGSITLYAKKEKGRFIE